MRFICLCVYAFYLFRKMLKNQPETETHGDISVAISSLTCDSRAVIPGTLFFALRGSKADGHRYIEQAVRAGAAAVVLADASFAPAQGQRASYPWLAADSTPPLRQTRVSAECGTG